MIQLPAIQNYDRCQPYFIEFMRLNASAATHRALAAQLKWPASLLGDLVSGRRKLSIARAVEFAQAFRFTGPETERLVLLAVREIDSKAAQSYVEQYLSTEGEPMPLPSEDGKPPEQAPQDVHYVPSSLIGDSAAMALHAFLHWKSGGASLAEIRELLDVFPEFATDSGILEKIERLRAHGVIEGEIPRLHVIKVNLAGAGTTSQDQIPSFELLKAIGATGDRRGSWNIGQVLFPRSLYQELNQRVTNLRNWILQTARARPPEGSFERREHLLLQIHLCVTNLVAPGKLGLELRDDGRQGQNVVELGSGSALERPSAPKTPPRPEPERDCRREPEREAPGPNAPELAVGNGL